MPAPSPAIFLTYGGSGLSSLRISPAYSLLVATCGEGHEAAFSKQVGKFGHVSEDCLRPRCPHLGAQRRGLLCCERRCTCLTLHVALVINESLILHADAGRRPPS